MGDEPDRNGLEMKASNAMPWPVQVAAAAARATRTCLRPQEAASLPGAASEAVLGAPLGAASGARCPLRTRTSPPGAPAPAVARPRRVATEAAVASASPARSTALLAKEGSAKEAGPADSTRVDTTKEARAATAKAEDKVDTRADRVDTRADKEVIKVRVDTTKVDTTKEAKAVTVRVEDREDTRADKEVRVDTTRVDSARVDTTRVGTTRVDKGDTKEDRVVTARVEFREL